MYIYIMKKDQLEADGAIIFDIRDHYHIFILIAIRSINLGVKYGYYSAEHIKIFRSLKLPHDFQMDDMLSNILNTNNIDNVRRRMQISMNQLGIDNSSFELEIIKNQENGDTPLVRTYDQIR